MFILLVWLIIYIYFTYFFLYASKITFYKNKIVPWRKPVGKGDTESQVTEGRAADLSGVVREVPLRR